MVFNLDEVPWSIEEGKLSPTGRTKMLIGRDFVKSGSLKIMKLSPNENFNTHEHNFLQLLYFMNGEGKLTVDDDAYQIKPGLVAIVLPNQCHSVSNIGKETINIMVFEAYDVNDSDTPFVDF